MTSTPTASVPLCPTGQPQTQSVGQTFVNTAVPAGDCLWLNSKLVPNPSICDAVRSSGKPVVVAVTGQTVTFDASAAETVRVLDGIITFSTDASTTPATAVDSAGAWQTIVPACEGSDIFLSGALYTLLSGIAPGSPATSNDSVVWTATFAASDASVSFAWQWGAAAYSVCGVPPNSLDVAAVDGTPSGVPPEGAPRALLDAGALILGGTGSGTQPDGDSGSCCAFTDVTPCLAAPPSPPPPACFNGKPAVASLELAQWYNYTLPAGSWLYFTGAVQLTGGITADDSATLTATHSVLTFADDKGVVQVVPTLPAEVEVVPGASTSISEAGGSWHTVVLAGYAASGSQTLFSLASYQLTEDFTPLPGSVVEWAVDFGINRAGVTLQWSFAFAAYSDFTADLPSLDAGPTQTATAAAGTPGNKQYNTKLLQGGRDIGPGPIPAQDMYSLYTGDYCRHVVIDDLCSR